MVVGDDGQGVSKERADIVDTATYAKAICSAVAVAPGCPVVRNRRSADRHGAGCHVNAASEGVAAIGAVAAHGPVVDDGGVQNRGRTADDIEPAAEAGAAITVRPTGAAPAAAARSSLRPMRS